MEITAELVQAKLIAELLDNLPEVLARDSSVPFWAVARDQDGKTSRQLVNEVLPMLEEIWTQQQPALNYPALIFHYQETVETENSDCNETEQVATWFADLILTHPDPEVLSVLWLRYAAAIREVLLSSDFSFVVQISGQRIIENGPLESIFLRRGFLTVTATF